MKKYVFIACLMLATLGAAAQDTTDFKGRIKDPEVRKKVEAARAAYITERLELTAAEAEKFWPIYREYSEKRENIFSRLREMKKEGKSDEATLKEYHKARQEELDLEKSYSDRFLKVIPANKLVRLHESEREFRKLVVRQVLKNHHHGRRKHLRR
ncbi:MAG TPA: hypothetical protein VEB86_18255 [Chryseosolibacter sp.]|nr:hypothetical protein [Chryseosolibacter sp.]